MTPALVASWLVAAVLQLQPPTPAFAPLRPDGNGIPALARVVSVDVREQRLGDALRMVARAAGADFSAAGDLGALERRVSLDTTARRASVALLRLVAGAEVELLVSAGGPTVVARAPRRLAGGARLTIRGTVRDFATGEPIAGALAELRTTAGAPPARAYTGADGRFALASARGGSAALRVRRLGYLPQDILLRGTDDSIVVRLARAALPLSAVVVTPGYYGVMEQQVSAPQTLTREQIRAAPQVGEDLFRSVGRLPGVTSSDFSAAFRVRGGANRELYASLDGLELVEPFHLKDFDGAISIVDVGAIAGLDLTTGGFGAQYGNRLTGVFAMRAVNPPPRAPTRTELALTLTTARATSHGSFAGDRGGWLLSARRGFLEYALRAAGEDDDLRPSYYDVLGKTTYRIGERATLALHALRAGDRLTYQDDPEKPRIVSAYGSTYLWAVATAAPGHGLSTESTVSVGRLDWARDGSRTSPLDAAQDLIVRDRRAFTFAGVRQDWHWERSPALLINWGGELRRVGASYDYARQERTLVVSGRRAEPVWRAAHADADPTGTTLGAYVTLKAQPASRLTTELGVRADRQSYTGEQQASPRVAVALEAAARTTVRAAWGRYTQPQGLHELQTADGATGFGRAELAEHRVLGLERRVGTRALVRVEAYERRLLRVQPRYVSVDNSIDVFPEVEPDRRLFAPSSGLTRGVEMMATRSPGRRVTWSASYALAVGRDAADGRSVPRTLDQRHTVGLDAGWRPSPRWQVNGAWLYHSGWPTTAFAFAADTLADGRILARRVYGARNADRLAPYHRLDVRATRTVPVGSTQFSVFVDLFNVYDRRNPRAYDPVIAADGERVTFGRRVDALLPRLPSVGLSWEF